MIKNAFHLYIFLAGFFVIGMFKPHWPLFFIQKPSRSIIAAISLVLFMIATTMYGEGVKQKNTPEQAAQLTTHSPDTAEIPIAPEPSAH